MRLLQSSPAAPLFIPEQFSPAVYYRSQGIGDTTVNDWWTNYNSSTGTSTGNPQSTGSQVAGSMVGGVMVGFQTALTTGSKTAGGIAAGLMAAAPFAGPAAPFLVVAAGLIGPVFNMFKGCGTTCTQATEIANKAGEALEQIKNQYFSQPVRYKASQIAALYTIEQVAGYINSACGNPQLGAAGQRCISERTVRGGTAPWCPTSDHRGCDLWTTYYDPIANDSGAVNDPGPASTGGTDVLTGSGQAISVGGFPLPMPLIIGGAALLALVMLTGGDN